MDVRHVLHAPLLWDKNTCCRCGAPQVLWCGDYSQGGQGGGQGKGGMCQGGVATGMGGLRVLGPNGRDQTHTPGVDPSYRKRAPGEGEAIPGAGLAASAPQRVRRRRWDPAGEGLKAVDMLEGILGGGGGDFHGGTGAAAPSSKGRTPPPSFPSPQNSSVLLCL